MTTDSVFILFKKDFNTILACLWVGCIGDGGVVKFLLPKWGVAVLSTPTFCKFGTHPSEENASPPNESGYGYG